MDRFKSYVFNHGKKFKTIWAETSQALLGIILTLRSIDSRLRVISGSRLFSNYPVLRTQVYGFENSSPKYIRVGYAVSAFLGKANVEAFPTD